MHFIFFLYVYGSACFDLVVLVHDQERNSSTAPQILLSRYGARQCLLNSSCTLMVNVVVILSEITWS